MFYYIFIKKATIHTEANEENRSKIVPVHFKILLHMHFSGHKVSQVNDSNNFSFSLSLDRMRILENAKY